MKKFHWKKQKAIAMYLNKRQAIKTQGNVNTYTDSLLRS